MATVIERKRLIRDIIQNKLSELHEQLKIEVERKVTCIHDGI